MVGAGAPACELLSMKLEQVVAGCVLLAVEVLLLAVQGAAAQGRARTIASLLAIHGVRSRQWLEGGALAHVASMLANS